ncbi:DUF4886 domain-containing protein [Antarcticibacterium sp. 1MA-6-2]|uniref:DUF4886 domain-containing protein n=1 Tax=Antarcticibacterium sp. 1MA-6-2 TaxID=2908210 RepID=UPI002107E222|nr:DUF4886 domain-containing protein [Antarcticibacterium sp. 1MA-6-2]
MKSTNYFISLLFFLCFAIIIPSTFIACEKEDQLEEPRRELAIELESARLKVGQDIVLKPIFSNYSKQQEYVWEVSDPAVLEVSSVSASYDATITAVGEGTATATIRTKDGSQEASTTIQTDLIKETEVSIPATITAHTQSTVSIVPEFNLVDVPARSYSWTSNPEGIISFETDPNTYAVEIQGLVAGTTELTITSGDGEVVGSTTVTVVDDNSATDGVLKILAIGNSFSEDAIEYYLYGLANAADQEIVIGNLYIGGAELSQHVANANSNANSYSYRKVGLT